MTEHEIRFAASPDQLDIRDCSVFKSMLGHLPHPRRSVPVPRRVLRALAGGFTAGMAAVTLAVLIRSVFWHKSGTGMGKSGGGAGAFRIDGRTRREWIAGAFGVTPRTVTEARARLIELGWLIPLDTPQHLLNRYGAYDAINPGWNPAQAEPDGEEKGGCDAAGSSSPEADFSGKSSSPCSNKKTSPSGNQETRRLRPRTGPAGVSRTSTGKKGKSGGSAGANTTAPNIRDIRPEDLADIGRLLQLHDQAVRIGIAGPGEANRLDFLALAERARMHGRRSGALFFWLLRERKTEFITQAAEDEAARRFKVYNFGLSHRQPGRGNAMDGPAGGEANSIERLTADERVVRTCLRVGQHHRVDPFRIASRTHGWTLDRWEQAAAEYEAAECGRLQRRHGSEDEY